MKVLYWQTKLQWLKTEYRISNAHIQSCCYFFSNLPRHLKWIFWSWHGSTMAELVQCSERIPLGQRWGLSCAFRAWFQGHHPCVPYKCAVACAWSLEIGLTSTEWHWCNLQHQTIIESYCEDFLFCHLSASWRLCISSKFLLMTTNGEL